MCPRDGSSSDRSLRCSPDSPAAVGGPDAAAAAVTVAADTTTDTTTTTTTATPSTLAAPVATVTAPTTTATAPRTLTATAVTHTAADAPDATDHRRRSRGETVRNPLTDRPFSQPRGRTPFTPHRSPRSHGPVPVARLPRRPGVLHRVPTAGESVAFQSASRSRSSLRASGVPVAGTRPQ